MCVDGAFLQIWSYLGIWRHNRLWAWAWAYFIWAYFNKNSTDISKLWNLSSKLEVPHLSVTLLQTKSDGCIVFMYNLFMKVCFYYFLGLIFCWICDVHMYWLLYVFRLYVKVAHPDYSMPFDSWHWTKKFYYFEILFITLNGTLPYLIVAYSSVFTPVLCIQCWGELLWNCSSNHCNTLYRFI